MNTETFWKNVNNLIKSKNTTQERLCKECDLNIGTLRNRISKNIPPDVIEALKIAQALGTTVEYLITGEEPAENTKYEELKEALEKLIQQN